MPGGHGHGILRMLSGMRYALLLLRCRGEVG